MEPDEEDHQADEGAVGQAHGGYVEDIVAVGGGEADPDEGDKEGGGNDTVPVGPSARRCVFVEGGQGEGDDDEGNGKFGHCPELEQHVGDVEVVGNGIDHGITEDDEPQGQDHGEGNEEGEDNGFGVYPQVGLLVPVAVHRQVCGADQGVHSLGGGPQGTGKTDEQPYGASSLDDTEDVRFHSGCHIGGQVGKEIQYHMDLGRRKEEHTVHQKDEERNEAQDEIIGSFCGQGRYVVIVKPLNEALDKKHGAAVRAFRFHGMPPFRP